MDYAFDHLGFEKLVFANAVGNSRSGRVKEKTMAKLIDIQPAKFVNPKYTEHEIWELKKEDWDFDKNYYLISSDKKLINIDQVHEQLFEAYWSKGIENSLCFGVYKNNIQVGFARVVTDSATFAWLCDVIIDEKHRGHGLSKELMHNILNHPQLIGLRRICLATTDAHELYKQFSFKVTEAPQNWMEIKNNDIYLKAKNVDCF
jgi:RimJ/RimL family protein N-acetyltransferase